MSETVSVVATKGNFYLQVVTDSYGHARIVVTWNQYSQYGNDYPRWKFPKGFFSCWMRYLHTKWGQWWFHYGLKKGHRALERAYHKWKASEEVAEVAKEVVQQLVERNKANEVFECTGVQTEYTEEKD
jgi:hypothetical protein